jgi:hypothetical protein
MEIAMITLNDVDKLIVDSGCAESYPCQHSCKITLKDGRSYSKLNSVQICSIISKLAKEKINPNDKWEADKVIAHFSDYNNLPTEFGWNKELPEEILNQIFKD